MLGDSSSSGRTRGEEGKESTLLPSCNQKLNNKKGEGKGRGREGGGEGEGG